MGDKTRPPGQKWYRRYCPEPLKIRPSRSCKRIRGTAGVCGNALKKRQNFFGQAIRKGRNLLPNSDQQRNEGCQHETNGGVEGQSKSKGPLRRSARVTPKEQDATRREHKGGCQDQCQQMRRKQQGGR